MAPAELAGVLGGGWRRQDALPAYQEAFHEPKKPKPKKQSEAKIKHVFHREDLDSRRK